jgi:phosphoglycerate dehydrogenase-like enzyme
MILRFPDATEAMARPAAGPLAAILPGVQTEVAAPNAAALIERAQDADGLVLMRTRIDASTLAALPRLRALAFLSAGVASWVDLAASAARGVAVRGVGDLLPALAVRRRKLRAGGAERLWRSASWIAGSV